MNKLKKGDKVAILSPSSAGPAIWPHVYELGIKRLKEEFDLIPVEYPTTKKIGATGQERINDLESAFLDTNIKGVITSIGGSDESTYIKNIKPETFVKNPKPFFGFSDNTHLCNFLFINGISSFYGGAILTQYAFSDSIDDITRKYLEIALFEKGEFELHASDKFADEILDWSDPSNLSKKAIYEKNEGWIWDGNEYCEGISWGGCLESIDEMLEYKIKIPSIDNFGKIILMTETSEEIPSTSYCENVYEKLGSLGIISRVVAVMNGRPRGWFFDKKLNKSERQKYRENQRLAILKIVRKYNKDCPVVQNMDFGHTNPQIPMPYGSKIKIDSLNHKIYATF